MVAEDWENYQKAQNAYYEGDYQKAFQLFMALTEEGNGHAQNVLGVMLGSSLDSCHREPDNEPSQSRS